MKKVRATLRIFLKNFRDFRFFEIFGKNHFFHDFTVGLPIANFRKIEKNENSKNIGNFGKFSQSSSNFFRLKKKR